MRHYAARLGSVLFFVHALLFCSTLIFAQDQTADTGPNPEARMMRHPQEHRLVRGKPFNGDLRSLPQVGPEKFERPEFEEPDVTPIPFPGSSSSDTGNGNAPSGGGTPAINVPAPAASNSFDGLDFANWGAGHPPDTNGDVGPSHYIQTINTSVGIYRKTDGTRLTAFTFNTLMSQSSLGNLCDTNNFGDPVVLYDTFEDRWIITDFAFQLSGGLPISPAFQCFAVSKSGDPVTGGWNFYSIQVTTGFDDYPKFGIWPDGLYMSANMFSFGAGSFQNVRVWAFNKAQMYAGNATVQVLSFDAPSAEFTMLPANARLQTGTPPQGSPNYFVVVRQFLNAISVYKFHVDWNDISTSTFSGPFIATTPIWWAQYSNSGTTSVPSPANRLDSLYPRLMMQNQYSNIGGVESLWTSHTVGAGNPTSNVTSSQSAVRYYQVKVTGGTVESTATQSFTYSPDTTVFRFMPSVDVDRAGDMAIGYSASNATLNPAIRYAGRLAGDPVNSITQTETSLIEGTGTQSGNCGGSSCIRWGDYSAMTLDPDGCTFWYTNMYYQTTGLSFNTRIGAFSFPSCTPVSTGTLQGTVTDSGTGNPISGATVALGSRTTTTDTNGNYSFSALPSGTYPRITASFPGYVSSTVTGLVVADGQTTTQNFSLALAPTSGCLTDTTQADFQGGIPTNCDLTTSPGDVILLNATTVDQQNTTLSTSGFGINATSWSGQTFKAGVTGQLIRADVNLFCAGCAGTTPNLILSVRATSGGLPTGPDLVSGTIPGFSSGAAVFYSVTFSTPPTLTAGTTYALIVHPVSNPSAGTYAFTVSGTVNPYPNGNRVSSGNSGAAWTAPTPLRSGGFHTFMNSGFAPSGTFVSSLKDANPAPNATVNWNAISWTANTPAGTSIQFQVAASNNAVGPFNFAGPDGTPGTFFSNGGSLSQFTGMRYLKYQASLSTSNGTITPTLNDVTICFNNIAATSLSVAPASGSFGGTADLSATLTSNGTGVIGKQISFTLNGNNVGSSTTDSSGTAIVPGVSLAGINAGSYPGAVAAAFAGDSGFAPASGSAALTVSKANQTIAFAPLPDRTFGDPDFTVSAKASSGLAVTFTAGGNCSVSGSLVHITGAGPCTITASQAGDSNNNPAPDVQQSFSIARANQTITFAPLPNRTFGDPPFTVSAAGGGSGNPVTFNAVGNCTSSGVNGSTITITGAGSCTVTASQTGNANYNAAPDVPQSFTIGQAGAIVVVNGFSGVYDGHPHGATGTATGINGENLNALLNLGASFTNVPGGTANWSFAGNTDYQPASGSVSIAISKATATFSGLSSPSINEGATPTSLSGKIGLGSLIPTGSVSITLNGVTQNAAIQPDGSFSSSFATVSLTPTNPPYSIAYSYGGDTNFNGTSGTGTLTVSFGALVLYDQTKSAKSGSTIPIKFELTNSAGVDVSSASITVTAVKVVLISTGASSVVQDSGNANPDDNFRFDPTLGTTGGYIFNLSTKGLGTGSYQLLYVVQGDPVTHALLFQVQ